LVATPEEIGRFRPCFYPSKGGKTVAVGPDMGWDEIIPYGLMCLLSAAAYGLACWLGCLV